MASQAATSASQIRAASAWAAAPRSPSASGFSARCMASTAQRRFTAVGRLATSAAAAAASPASDASARVANAMPQAAVAPISGAPRTTRWLK